VTPSAARCETSNPLHRLGSPRTAWSIANTAENFPGIATPLGWTFWADPLERGMCGGFANIGVLSEAQVIASTDVTQRFSSAIYGRFCANVDRMRAVADLMPGTSASETELQVFGSVRPDKRNEPSRRRYPVVAVKMPAAIIKLPKQLRAMRAETDAWWRSATRPETLATLEQAGAALVQAGEQFERTMRIHITATMWASALYGQLTNLATASGNPGLETALVSGYGGMEETESITELWDVSRGKLTIEDFIARHGYHAPVEAELASLSWREDPGPALARAASYQRKDDAFSPERLAARQCASRIEAQRRVLDGLPAYRRAPARLLMTIAARYIPLREMGKASFLQTIDAGRAAARALGRHLHRDGVLAAPDDVYYLTVEELTGQLPAQPRESVSTRRALHAEYESFTIPDFWVGEPARLPLQPQDADVTEVTGIAVSPGIVEGIARVMGGPDSGDLDDGEILVCRTTDPSWASLFLVAGGLVIDIGAQMSHGAIVAREMGIPCIINTRNGTTAIRTGDRIRVDGCCGTATILERSLQRR
jgi:phosphohistidine swiveling domain-containing protein